MSRVLPIAILVALALMVFAIVDVALIDRARVRGIPRWAWIVAIVLAPVVGAVLWLTVGRIRLGDIPGARATGPQAPDDDPQFLRRLERERAMEERIAELEKELRDLDDDDPKL